MERSRCSLRLHHGKTERERGPLRKYSKKDVTKPPSIRRLILWRSRFLQMRRSPANRFARIYRGELLDTERRANDRSPCSQPLDRLGDCGIRQRAFRPAHRGCAEHAPPNVLFIGVDDLRPEIFSFGREQMETPNLDRLAERGVRFERAYCMVPTCGASRASLMTGIGPARNRFVSPVSYAEKEAPGITTLNTHFNRHGYTPEPKEYSHDYLMKETLNFIGENANNPFFLYLPFTIPHENGEQLKDMKFEVPNQGVYADKPWTKEQKDYAAMISYLDAGIGDIVQATRSAEIANKTLILFCSDNGPMRGHPVTEFFDSNGDLRGGKRDLYEGGIRSPLIAYWPTVVPARKESTHIYAAWDFFPPFASWRALRSLTAATASP